MHNYDAIAFLDGREAVGNDERSAFFHHTFDRLLYELFGFGVDRACRLVEDQYGRVKRQGPRKRDQLFLSDGQTGPAFPDPGLIAALDRANKLVGMYLAGGPLDPVAADLSIS